MANRLYALSEWENEHAPPPRQSPKWSQAELLLATIFSSTAFSSIPYQNLRGIGESRRFFMRFFANYGKSGEETGIIYKKFVFSREMETLFLPWSSAPEI